MEKTKGLQPHEVRVVEERTELNDKITKLLTFMASKFYQTLDSELNQNFEEQVKLMKAYSDVLLRRINSFEGTIENTVIELTQGQELVGLTFNPSNLSQVDKAKRLSASLIDMVIEDHNVKTDYGNKIASWNRNVLRTAAVTAVVAAQMAVVKILTWSK